MITARHCVVGRDSPVFDLIATDALKKASVKWTDNNGPSSPITGFQVEIDPFNSWS
jgi:hypothetical protein